MRLPQELCAEELWLRNYYGGYISAKEIGEILRKNNLKLKKGKTLDDVWLAFGRGLKNIYGNAIKAREQIAEEIDKVCIIARWDFAVEKYSHANSQLQS